MAPNAVVFRPGKTVAYYINAAGGFTDRSRRSRVYVIYQNGKASINVLNNAKVEPGCTIQAGTQTFEYVRCACYCKCGIIADIYCCNADQAVLIDTIWKNIDIINRISPLQSRCRKMTMMKLT